MTENMRTARFKLIIRTLVVYYCSQIVREAWSQRGKREWIGMKGIYLADLEIGLYTVKVCTLLTWHVVSSLVKGNLLWDHILQRLRTCLPGSSQVHVARREVPRPAGQDRIVGWYGWWEKVSRKKVLVTYKLYDNFSSISIIAAWLPQR